MVQLTVKLDEEAAAALEQIIETTKKSSDEVIADLLTGRTKVPRRRLPIGAGQYHSGQPDLAERTEEILRSAVQEGKWP